MIFINILMISFNIPLSLIGSIINITALYCLWCIKRNSELSNSDKLVLTLNTADTVFSAIILPLKITSYFLNPDLKSKPRYHVNMDGVNIFFTSFIISFIAFNRYIKMSKASRHHVILSKTRLHRILALGFILSLLLPTLIYIDITLMANISALMLISTNIQLFVFYALIKRTTKASRRRIGARKNVNNNGNGTTSISKTQDVVVSNRERRLSRNVLILMSAYFFCCFCLFAMLINHSIKESSTSFDLIKIGVWFMSLNSVINPVIYTLRNHAYQRIIKRLLRTMNSDSREEIRPSNQIQDFRLQPPTKQVQR